MLGSELLHLVSYWKDDQTATEIFSSLRAGSQKISIYQTTHRRGIPGVPHGNRKPLLQPLCAGAGTAPCRVQAGQDGPVQVTQRHGVMEIALESLSPGFGPIPREGVQGIHKQMKARSRPPALTPAGSRWAA